ncbi:hypothetical protein PHYBOEH_003444 [Phytophthora boehmeriae]|uniref:RxLR effector protein n=1 Tax=Phytophthora boehmeriae TaxID=109152 RepID=A0A8T1WNW2_9STRA|nr:hypothetical protein PHYBOEH_003444 [Phytophthora boehmeriae]
MGTSGFIQASDAQQSSPTENRFLRTIKTVDEKAGNSEDEERGLLNALKKLKLRSKLYTDGGIRRSRKTFNDWYRSGLTPDDVWNSLKPIVNGGYDPKYQTYLNYKKFYDIKKALSRKKA